MFLRMNHIALCAALIPTLFLSACGVDRDMADKKLARACQAGITVFIQEGYSIKDVKNTEFTTPDRRSEGDRRIVMHITESDGWYDTQKTYACNFVEKIGLFGAYSASIYQLDLGDRVIGSKDGQITGSYQEWLKVTNAVQAVLER